jgi:hypothetical protein
MPRNLAVSQELQRREHRVIIATHVMHRQPAVRAGLVFADASGIEGDAIFRLRHAKALHP